MQLVVRKNFVGSVLSSIERLELTERGLVFRKKRGSVEIPIRELVDFAVYRKSIVGHSISTITKSNSYKIGMLRQENVSKLVEELNALIRLEMESRIQKLERDFKKYTEEEYLRDSKVLVLQNSVELLFNRFALSPDVWKANINRTLITILKRRRTCFPISQNAEMLREQYEESVLLKRKDFYDAVEKSPLTKEQRLAVVRNNDRNLVLAAAGTGKTSVIVAKALDIMGNQKTNPSKILVLAYNKAAAKELQDRIATRAERANFNIDILPKVKTFHALGREILQSAGITTYISVFMEDEHKFQRWVTIWLSSYIQSSEGALKEFLKILYQPCNEFDFQTAKEYDSYIRDNEFRALQGERVKGYQELLIANWLFLNSIEYEYEPQYTTKRRFEPGIDYKPDFRLQSSDIYLEHFGIDRNGQTRVGIDANEYNNHMRLKRELHDKQGTKLLETFHYDWVENNLETRLEEQLRENNILPIPLSEEKIFNKLQENGTITKKSELLLGCLRAIRVEGIGHEEILQRLTNDKVASGDIWVSILTKLERDYRDELNRQNAIDYDDMILRAADEIKKGKYSPGWKHILVDEFQDISTARMNFISQLMSGEETPTFTAVGDDWQAIYRFTGGKLALTTRFENLIGSNTTTKLQKTFRYNDSIAHVAGTFIMENPGQYEKHIETVDKVSKSQVYLIDNFVDNENNMEEKVARVIDKIRIGDLEGEISILARYQYLRNRCRDYNRQRGFTKGINYWTFHGSKGLESDYCILVGFFHGKTGFPNYKKDEKVKEALLPQSDAFPHSEERRLLYVALTRARYKSYIIADAFAPSEFVTELLSPKYNLNIASEMFKAKHRQIYKCSRCTDGFFTNRAGKFGNFYRCAACGFKPRNCETCGAPSIDGISDSKCNDIDCGQNMKICKVCGRPMKIRDGQYGKFLGCSGYGIQDDRCKHTENV